MSNDTQRRKDVRKRKQSKTSKQTTESTLENILFGKVSEPSVAEKAVKTEDSDAETTHSKKRKVKIEDLDPDSNIKAEVDYAFENTEDLEDEKPVVQEVVRKSAWQDDDDDEEEESIDISKTSRLRKLRTDHTETTISSKDYESRLREHFETSSANSAAASWAELPSTRTEIVDEADEITSRILSNNTDLSYTGGKTRTVTDGLRPPLPIGKIEVTRVTDANIDGINMSVTTSGRFHPNGELFMTAGLDKTVRLFQIDCERNTKIQSVHIPDLPIYCARYNSTKEIVLTGRRKYFYTYDLIHGAVTKIPYIRGRDEKSLEQFEISPDGSMIGIIGTDGHVLFLHGSSKQLMNTIRAPTRVANIAFTSDNTQCYVTCGNGNIYVYDLRTFTCISKFVDDGTVHGTCIAVSKDNNYLVTGNDSGIMNIYDTVLPKEEEYDDYSNYYTAYDTTTTLTNSKKPLKAITNLTTSISNLSISPSNEIIAVASRNTKDALKLVHLPSMTVFSNWPTQKTPLGYVQDIDFSPNSGLLAISNDKGKTLLYRLNHYGAI